MWFRRKPKKERPRIYRLGWRCLADQMHVQEEERGGVCWRCGGDVRACVVNGRYYAGRFAIMAFVRWLDDKGVDEQK